MSDADLHCVALKAKICLYQKFQRVLNKTEIVTYKLLSIYDEKSGLDIAKYYTLTKVIEYIEIFFGHCCLHVFTFCASSLYFIL